MLDDHSPPTPLAGTRFRWFIRGTAAGMLLVAVAIAVGMRLGMEFDRVMMGIFLCWTPQSAVVAAALTITLLVRQGK